MRARFRLLAILQVVLLLVTVSGLAWIVLNTEHLAVPVVVGSVILLQLLILVRFVENHVDALEEFFAAINYEDFTQRFVTNDVDAELKGAFNQILERFQSARADREVQANYLEVVVRHVPVPLLAVRADGSVRLLNNPAIRLTGIPGLKHLDELSLLDADLPQSMRSIEPGHQRLLQASVRDVPVELRIAVSEIRMGGEAERLYSIENLSGELTARESSAWRNLIRVLTHEIMNTLTPVSSLAQTCGVMLDDPAKMNDVREAVSTIARRSEGLMQFVSQYRELLKVPQPIPADLAIDQVFGGILTLTAEQLVGVTTETLVDPPSLSLRADPQLLDQLLLNVVKNAAEAMQDTPSPRLELSAKLEYGRTVIRIHDNGPGMPEGVADQIFIPFFTTKRDGSGIGLSLARQIMTAHGGEIAVNRKDDKTVVSLVF